MCPYIDAHCAANAKFINTHTLMSSILAALFGQVLLTVRLVTGEHGVQWATLAVIGTGLVANAARSTLCTEPHPTRSAHLPGALNA